MSDIRILGEVLKDEHFNRWNDYLSLFWSEPYLLAITRDNTRWSGKRPIIQPSQYLDNHPDIIAKENVLIADWMSICQDNFGESTEEIKKFLSEPLYFIGKTKVTEDVKPWLCFAKYNDTKRHIVRTNYTFASSEEEAKRYLIGEERCQIVSYPSLKSLGFLLHRRYLSFGINNYR